MLFTNFLKKQNLLPVDKENNPSNQGVSGCIVNKWEPPAMSDSAPHQLNAVQSGKMFGSTPLYENKVPDLGHISNLLQRRKEPHSKPPQKQTVIKEQEKKRSVKLCLNCEQFIASEEIDQHERACQDFEKLLDLSRHDLMVLIISKILVNEKLLSDTQKESQPGGSVALLREKILQLEKMKTRLQSKMKN